ncbi:MAG TPA: hypothetical protein VGY91_13295 [Chthoniobacterales bacterium]|jgi:hypothetical protein|nr:hypothetical protein [Chthoniobacterales bacterium]
MLLRLSCPRWLYLANLEVVIQPAICYAENRPFRAVRVLLLALLAGAARAQLTGLTEGFDDVPSLFTSSPSASNHWLFENLSNPPPGSTSSTGFWAQGIPSQFNDVAQAGPTNSFITQTFESGFDDWF